MNRRVCPRRQVAERPHEKSRGFQATEIVNENKCVAERRLRWRGMHASLCDAIFFSDINPWAEAHGYGREPRSARREARLKSPRTVHRAEPPNGSPLVSSLRMTVRLIWGRAAGAASPTDVDIGLHPNAHSTLPRLLRRNLHQRRATTARAAPRVVIVVGRNLEKCSAPRARRTRFTRVGMDAEKFDPRSCGVPLRRRAGAVLPGNLAHLCCGNDTATASAAVIVL